MEPIVPPASDGTVHAILLAIVVFVAFAMAWVVNCVGQCDDEAMRRKEIRRRRFRSWRRAWKKEKPPE